MKSVGPTHLGGGEKNEDSIFFEDDGTVCVVADGAGRGDSGVRAAQALTEKFPPALESGTMEEAFLSLDRDLHEITRPEVEPHHWMTVVARLSLESVEVGHIGNCRAYLFRGDDIVVQTTDHSIRNAIIDRRMPAPDKDFIYAEAITRSVGGRNPRRQILRSGNGALAIYSFSVVMEFTNLCPRNVFQKRSGPG